MAQSANQVLLELLVKATGADSLSPVVKQLQDITKAGGEAAPAAQEVLDELEKLGKLNTVATSLAADRAALQETGDALFLAKQKVAELQQQFAATAEPTAAMSRALAQASASVISLETKYTQLGVAIQKGDLALQAAGLDANNLDAAQRGLQASLGATAVRGAEVAASFKEQSIAAKQESLSLSEITERNAVLRASFEQLRDVLKTFAGLFALEKVGESIHEILDTGDKFTKWGQQFSAAFGGAEPGQEALEKIKKIADETPLSLDEVAKAALQAKKAGLDPLDGSLQALIDTTLKFGGSSSDLEALISALSKSANQGGLNLRALTQLEQQGVPAAKLLGDAIGKTAEQVTELAKQGKLGGDSVSTLINALGRANTGSVTQQMELLSAQTTKAKDNFDEFLNLIAKSGAYDFVRDQLKALNEEFKKGLEDGSLQQSAKAISDGLIKIGQALVSITTFAIEHAGAIATVTESYVAFKVAMLGLDLLGAAEKFAALTAATTAAGNAAEAAAAGAGGFGKLGAAINRIPKGIQIAIVASGVSEVLTQIEQLYDLTLKQYDLNKQVIEQRKDDARLQAELLEKSKALAAQTKSAADTQISSAEELEQKNRDQSAAYIESLQNAIRYYTAIKVQEQAIGNASGAKAATEKLRAFVVALQDANEHQKQLSDTIKSTSERVAASVERFDELRTRGVSAASAIQSAFDNIDLSNPRGLQTAIDIIAQISIRSREARDAVGTELLSALEKLNDADLRAFQENVSAQLKSATGNANALKVALGAALQEELTRLGLSAEQAGIKFTVAGQTIISTFEDVAKNASATGQQVQLAFAQAISKATTSGEIEALEAKLTGAFNAGKVSADEFQVASEAAGRRLGEIKAAAIVASASLDGTGKSGENSAQRIERAFNDARGDLELQAQKMAAAINAAFSSGDKAGAAALTGQLKVIEQEMAVLATKSLAVADALTQQRVAAEIANASAGNAQVQSSIAADKAAEAAKKAKEGFTEWGDAASQAALDTQKITADTSHANEGMDALVNGITNARNAFLQVSDAAAQAYDVMLKGAFDLGHSDDGSGFDRVARAMQTALTKITELVSQQRTELTSMVASVEQYGETGAASFDITSFAVQKQLDLMKQASVAIQDGTFKFGILGQQDLAPLRQAIDGAIARTQALIDKAKAANDAFASVGQQLQDELDQAQGNNDAIEDRAFKKRLDDLKAAAQAANKLNSQEYKQDVENATKLHELKLKQIADEQKKAAGGGSDTTGGTAPAPSRPSSGSGSGGVSFAGQPPPVIVQIHGGTFVGGTKEQVARDLFPALQTVGTEVQRRTTKPIFGNPA